jgi:hypothetical protein
MVERFASYPRRISAVLEHPESVYTMVDGYFAVRGPLTSHHPLSLVATLEDDLALYRGTPPDAVLSDQRLTVIPVYALSSDGPLAVPTGNIFLRYEESVDITTQREAIERAGYALPDALPYAPYSGWVRRSDGRIDEALAHMDALFRLPGIANVEPQMVSKRVLRSPSA